MGVERSYREKPTFDASEQNNGIIELHDLSGREECEKSAEREWKDMSRLRCGSKIYRKDQNSSPKRRRQINKTKAPSRVNRPFKDLD